MYVLIRGVGGENLQVTKIANELPKVGEIFEHEAIEKADDVIRKYLSDNELTSDITYEAADHPLGPGPMGTLVGVWVADDVYWELWGI